MRIHDGAYGTLLAAHLHGDETADDLCLRTPQHVVDAHLAYLEAGAGAIQTNSFLAHLRGSDRRRAELRRAAMHCARDAAAAARVAPLVVVTIGPAGDEPRDFWEPIEQALDGEARAVLCETVTTRAIADAFLAAWADVASGVRDVELMLGCSTRPADSAAAGWVVELAGDAPDDVLLGINCCSGPVGMRGLLAAIVERRGTSWAMPSAGIPAGEPPAWPLAAPARWADAVMEEVGDLPLAALGGCCGTDPDSIAALDLPA